MTDLLIYQRKAVLVAVINEKKMKIIAIILIILNTSLYSKGLNLDNYFDVVNRTLNIHKVSETEFLLYGDKGGVVRSYDAGETWTQNYAATKSNIVSMVNYKDFVIGVTTNNELIYSSDTGNHWDLKVIDIKPTNLVANSDLLFATEGNSSIFISSDMGENWKEKTISGHLINDLKVLNTQLFVSTKNYELYISTDFGESWSKVDLPDGMNSNQIHTIQVNEGKFYIRDIASIYRINNDLSFDKVGNGGSFNKYIVNADSLHYFSGNLSKRSFEYSNQAIESEEIIRQFKYHNPSYNPSSYTLTDVIKANNILLMTFFGKGIIRSTDYGKTWKVISHFPLFENLNNHKFFDKQEWNFSTQYFNLNTYNTGATFLPGYDYTIDTTSSAEYKSFIRSNYWINTDSVVYFLSKEFYNSSLSNCFVSNDRGYTLSPATSDLFEDLQTITRNDEDLFLYHKRSYTGLFGRQYTIMRLSDDFKLDSINSLDSIDQTSALAYYTIKNKTYLIYIKVDDEDGNTSINIDYTVDNFNTIKNVASVLKPNNLFLGFNSIYLSEKGYLFFKISSFKNDVTVNYRLNIETNEVEEISENNVFRNPWETDFVDNKILLSHYKSYDSDKDTTVDKYRAVRVNVTDEGDLLLDTLLEDNKGYSFSEIDDDIIAIGIQSLLRPIEEDRLTSVKVENSTEIIGIWPFEPYPNPARERISVYFYTELYVNINELKVELISISTGMAYPIDNYEISFMNNWDGLIDFDISQFPTGSYLINMKLGEYQKSSKLIIAR